MSSVLAISLIVFIKQDVLRFIAIDILAIGIVLVGDDRTRRSLEGTIKLGLSQFLAGVLLAVYTISGHKFEELTGHLLFLIGFGLKFGVVPFHRAWLDYCDGSSRFSVNWMSYSYRLWWLYLLVNVGSPFETIRPLVIFSLLAAGLLILPQSGIQRSQAYLNIFITSLSMLTFSFVSVSFGLLLMPIFFLLTSIGKSLAT